MTTATIDNYNKKINDVTEQVQSDLTTACSAHAHVCFLITTLAQSNEIQSNTNEVKNESNEIHFPIMVMPLVLKSLQLCTVTGLLTQNGGY